MLPSCSLAPPAQPADVDREHGDYACPGRGGWLLRARLLPPPDRTDTYRADLGTLRSRTAGEVIPARLVDDLAMPVASVPTGIVVCWQ